MKKSTLIASLVTSVTFTSIPLGAANHVVQVGDKIQDKVSGASSGDVVIVRGGTFPEQAVTITQPMRLVREKGQNVTIGGTITLSGVTGDIVLRDFAIDVNGNGKLVISNCSKVGLEDLTDLPQGVEISNSTVVMRSCQLGNLTITGNSDVQVIDSTLANLTTTGSKVQAVDSAMAVLTATDSNLTLAKSTHTTGTITRGQTLYQGSTANGDVSINASDWRAHGSTFKSNLSSSNAHSKLLKTTVEKAFSHIGAAKDCVVFQSTVGRVSGHALYSDANRTWVTYSDIHHVEQIGGTEAHLVKNRFLTDKDKNKPSLKLTGANCIYYINNNLFWKNGSSNIAVQYGPVPNNQWKHIKTLSGGMVTKVTNSIHIGGDYYSSTRSTTCKVSFIYSDGTKNDVQKARTNGYRTYDYGWGGQTYDNPHPSKPVREIEIHLHSQDNGHEKDTVVHRSSGTNYEADISISDSKKIAINNNLFRRPDGNAHCIYVGDAPDDGLSIHGNAFWRDSGTWKTSAVNAPSGGECSHNFFHSANTAHTVTGGIAHFDNVLGGDPKINTSSYTLNADSPLIDAGPEEPQFNDHDGSRNDIGMFGGHAYDPAGTTSVNPVVLSGAQNIVRMNVGDSTPIVIKARAAVSTPNQ